MKMTKAQKIKQWEEMEARYNAEAEKFSTGVLQKEREVDIRDMTTARGVQYATDLRARRAGRGDIIVTDKDGNKLVLEVKHGAGALAYADPQHDIPLFQKSDKRDPDECLQGVDWVVYHRHANLTDRRDIACEYIVMKREDFLDAIIEYAHGPRSYGFETATKYSKKDKNSPGYWQINIQTQYVSLFWDGIQADERGMTLWDFCSDVLGREPRWKK